MPPKQKTPAPIDRPLSRAYLREFTGWSTAYPPGISDPTSLRLMENVMVNRDGSIKIRPGLRYLSTMEDGSPIEGEVVGTHEPFFLNSGIKAYLFAMRLDTGEVGFRVLADLGSGLHVYELDETGIDFDIPQTEPAIRFTEATTYVKYLQIDNKIFALSNAGETMRYFTVGTAKTAKRLNSLERPAWDASDKLTVVHPDDSWIASGVPLATRYNLVRNPSFETSLWEWEPASYTAAERTSAQARVGGAWSMRLGIHAFRTNFMPNPLTEPAATATGWVLGGGWESGSTIAIDGTTGRLRGQINGPGIGSTTVVTGPHYLNSPAQFPVVRQPQWEALPPSNWVTFDFGMGSDAGDISGAVSASCMVRWFDGSGVQVGSDDYPGLISVSGTLADGHFEGNFGTVPFGAVSMSVFPYMYIDTSELWAGASLTSGQEIWFEISNVMVIRDAEKTGYFDGDTGADYYWTGATNASASVHALGMPIETTFGGGAMISVSAGTDYAASVYVRAATDVATFELSIDWYSGGSLLSTDTGAAIADVNSSWATRVEALGTAPVGATHCKLRLTSTTDVEWLDYHYVDDAMVEPVSAVDDYFNGSFTDTSTELYSWTGVAHDSTSTFVEYAAPGAVPGPATPTANTLIDSTAADNVYNFGFFYTFANEVGESAPSQVTVVKAQRGWSQWRWETANTDAEPSGTHTDDPNLCADQLVAYMPSAVFGDAMDQGATKWHLYMLTWSDQDPAPVNAVRLATRTLPVGAAHGSYGYLRMTPQQADANAEIAFLPSEVNRFNYSTPSSSGQGIVAGDRMVMVFDPASAGVVRWSSNEMGSYSDFSANKGGGFKTLSSGNLLVPAAVKLWQNPQSADTITILCMGTDGQSTGYYMAPSQVASQSEATNIMGFEETTATPGTVSPYGCEVVNNALFHPLDEMLMKSSASNYNINHASLTDQIENVWRGLQTKDHIVSSLHDNRVYYLVNNPLGEQLEEGCWGNEVWVYDAQQKAGSWSRWLVQGHSLRKFEQAGVVSMSLVRPDGIYYFDEAYTSDEFVDEDEIATRSIPWFLETNTQGANRAHDAWAHVQQCNIVVGNFQGVMHYGIKGLDIHGQWLDISKQTRDANAPPTDGTLYDLEDFLLVRRDLKEWFFYAGSVEVDDVVQPSQGQISLVQYRYTPSTVNTGYEHGSVETFEYGRAAVADRTTDNGIPMPMLDTRRP